MRRHARAALIERMDYMNDISQARARILVVDDEEAIAELLTWVMRRAGYHVVSAIDGLQAWEFFQALPFDAVITDLKMPRMNGEQLTQRIKAQSPQTHVVVLTGHGTEVEVERLLKLGVTRVMHKPLREVKDMVSLIAQLLGR
jgi:CheY-like chemotaxis protein